MGTQRNHVLPDDSGVAGLSPDGGLDVCKAANIKFDEVSFTFVPDLIDLDELDADMDALKVMDSEVAVQRLNTRLDDNDKTVAEDVLCEMISAAVDYVHRQRLKAPP